MREISYVWFQYFWSSLKGNGPEALAQTVLYAAIALIFVPPVRRYVNNHVKSIHERLERHHKEAMDLARQHHREHLAALKPKEPLVAKKAPAVKKTTRRKPGLPK